MKTEEVFKTRVEAPVELETAPQSTKPQELQSDTLKGNETKVGEELDQEQLKLEIWEGEHRQKFITDYFGIKEYAEEFGLKMQTSTIDKYIKSELEKRKYDKTIDNYKSILNEIETEIGSNRLELFTRIKKITGYVKAVSRLNDAKEKLKLYSPSD